jgi:hypothetical protein
MESVNRWPRGIRLKRCGIYSYVAQQCQLFIKTGRPDGKTKEANYDLVTYLILEAK